MTTRSGRLKSSIAAPSRRNSGFETTANESLRRALGDDALDLVARADRDGRLNHDDGEVFDNLGDVASRVVNETHVGRADLRQRRRADGDEDRLRAAPGRFQVWS